MAINRKLEQGAIDQLAESDSIHQVPVGDNKSITLSSYAGHAISEILEEMVNGEIPQGGSVYWY